MSKLTEQSKKAFLHWRTLPAPQRGEYIRKFGEALRERKTEVAEQITTEAKKIISEGEGEVQEVIDMCDFATGLSRQLYGLTMPSERPNHRLQEIWQPLGVVGCVTAFNFPVAVFGWNFCLAAVCGNSIIWKPSPHSEGCAKLVKEIWDSVAEDHKDLVLIKNGANEAASDLAKDEGISLFSATGSCEMGRALAPIVAKRLGRSLLELGGNNAAIVCPSADLDLTIKAITFSAAGTTGQRCTTLRRLFVHKDIYKEVVDKLKTSFDGLKIGDPMDRDMQVGPLISEDSLQQMQQKLDSCRNKSLEVTGGDKLDIDGGVYVKPALVEVTEHIEEMNEETFAPILYAMPFDNLKEAIDLQNSVKQGLSSSIFTNDVRESELFLSAEGSDCGIANVNIGTSGAEIGGAFGGEKDTGGGRESGSDSRFFEPKFTPPLAIAICYEISDGLKIRKAVNSGAKLIITAANLDPYPNKLYDQFLSIAKLRSIENSKDNLLVSNTGPSGLISNVGKTLQILDLNTEQNGIVFPNFSSEKTFYTKFGDKPISLLLVISLILNFFWKIN